MGKTLELEIDSADNSSLFFRPLGRKLRGRLEWARCKNPLAVVTGQNWGTIPGQRVRIDLDGRKAFIIEPIHHPENAALLRKIEKAGLSLAAAEETFNLDENGLATWIFWIKRAVEDGNARILSGVLPEKLPGKIRTDFGGPRPVDPRDATIERLTQIVLGLLPVERRKEVAAALSE